MFLYACGMASTVHVLRHGEVFNPEKILYGLQPGWHLSDRGHEMAGVVAEWSRQFEVGAVHASPLQRAQEIQSNKTLMAQVKQEAQQQMAAISKVAK